jgi:hypothetical protein
VILLISVSQVARIIGVSYRCLVLSSLDGDSLRHNLSLEWIIGLRRNSLIVLILGFELMTTEAEETVLIE